jgi:DNA mismatch repair protein MutS2
MIDERTLQLLEWPRLAQALAERTRTPYGRDEALTVRPVEPAEAALVRERVAAWRGLLAVRVEPPLGAVPDVRADLADASRGAVFDGRRLLDAADNMELVTALGRFLGRPGLAPSLAGDAGQLPEFHAVTERIRRTIDASGGVREDASDALYKAAHEERSRSTELRERSERLLDDERFTELLRDRYVTQREGRFVLPLRIDRLSTGIKGIVHDASASGATVFFEPEELNHANNRLVETRAIIREEIARLLGELSRAVAAVAADLTDALARVGRVDAEAARARLAEEWGAVEPVDAAEIELAEARQPLLLLRGVEDIVPVDIRHPGRGRAVILSGPNAGGKTAALKTLGLSMALARAGCHVPARAARLPLGWDLAVELGDPQNLGEDLSTFSGHLSRLTEIGAEARPGMLFLVDELLKGTDPADGAPLARAWLEEMAGAGASLWVTTHYGSIKALPAFDDRFVAARTSYERGRPAFTIVYGEPGLSYAFETAERLGFPRRIIDRAQNYRKGEVTAAERALSEVDELRKQLSRAKKQADADSSEIRLLRDRLQSQLDLMQKDKTELVRRVAEGAISKLESAKQAAENAERAVKRRKEEGTRRRIEIGRTRTEVEKTVAEAEVPGHVEAADLKPGAVVYSRRLRRNGTVVRAPERGQVPLQVGTMQVTVKVEDLAPPQAGAAAPKAQAKPAPRAHPVPDSIDVRGTRLDGALGQIGAWLDGAQLAHQSGTLKIVHGIGTGALRDGVRAYLREHPAGWSFAPGNPDQGGDAVTIVSLD